jgi:uncharacterized protein (TIGR01777 family)
MKIFVTGGTGFVGSSLTKRLLERGHNVIVTSSSGKTSLPEHPSLISLKADTSRAGDWQNQLSDCDVIINLAGRSVFHLWSESYKNQIYSSRIQTTRNIVEGLPKKTDTVLLSASAAGYYGDGGEKEQSEDSPAGTDFLAEVCRAWESEALQAEEKGCRVALMRFGVVMGEGGGAISTMKAPFLLGLGGPIGSGRQWFPWIHLQDLIEAILFLMDGSDLRGPFNMTAPHMVRQKEFAQSLGKKLKRPTIVPAPAFIMRTLLGEFGKSLLQGQKAIPKALTDSGFMFSYQSLEGALEEILRG